MAYLCNQIADLEPFSEMLTNQQLPYLHHVLNSDQFKVNIQLMSPPNSLIFL